MQLEELYLGGYPPLKKGEKALLADAPANPLAVLNDGIRARNGAPVLAFLER